ncbi:hypothetical protein M405DRAFT_634469 [Rhizopogon salebrosus TDB-379]|nr:hypothetical protein M405DRAFT_634469 [Rhizopogon salebrosus TDB-379]
MKTPALSITDDASGCTTIRPNSTKSISNSNYTSNARSPNAAPTPLKRPNPRNGAAPSHLPYPTTRLPSPKILPQSPPLHPRNHTLQHPPNPPLSLVQSQHMPPVCHSPCANQNLHSPSLFSVLKLHRSYAKSPSRYLNLGGCRGAGSYGGRGRWGFVFGGRDEEA